MHPRIDLGAVLSPKQADGQYHPVTYGSRALMHLMRKTTTSTKLEFSGIEVGMLQNISRSTSPINLS